MSDDLKLKRFGKYLILDHLVDGGMAKICRARFLSEEVNKIVAIKMIQPQYSKDPAFVQMFQDELKVTFGLSHPNIAQTYDYGMVANQLYTAMEYVDGANLKQYLDRLKEKKVVFPAEISTYIISQVCQALYYAHSFTDKLTGKKFNIIHRDISPHNIMLTYDGNVKVIDFGIAKADSNTENTQAGTIKGKLSYLAPEYLEGHDLDHAYDQFAVGITLWEMLCSRKLFQAKNDLAVLKLIQACKVPPPSSINARVPKELDMIVLKALSKDRSRRYESMDKLNRALVRFLYSNYPDFNPSDLSLFSKQLFKEEIQKDRSLLVEYGKIEISKYINEYKTGANSVPETPRTAKSLNAVQSNGARKMDLDMDLAEEVDFELDINKKSKAKAQIDKSNDNGGTATGTRDLPRQVRAGSATSQINRGRVNRTSSYNVSQVTQKESSSSSFMAVVIVAVIAVVGYFKRNVIMEFAGFSNEEQTRTISSTEPAKIDTKKMGKLIIHNLDPSMNVYINGQLSTEIDFEKNVELDTKIKLEISKKGYKSYIKEGIFLTEENSSISVVVPKLIKEQVGMLWSGNNYVAGDTLEVIVEGQAKKINLPIDKKDPVRMPAGIYKAAIVNDAFQTKRDITFKIEVDKKIRLEE